jgi:hypothetical protein
MVSALERGTEPFSPAIAEIDTELIPIFALYRHFWPSFTLSLGNPASRRPALVSDGKCNHSRMSKANNDSLGAVGRRTMA